MNMKSGYCSCGKGVNYAPCKHENAAEEVKTFLMFLCEKNFEIESPEIEILISLRLEIQI